MKSAVIVGLISPIILIWPRAFVIVLFVGPLALVLLLLWLYRWLYDSSCRGGGSPHLIFLVDIAGNLCFYLAAGMAATYRANRTTFYGKLGGRHLWTTWSIYDGP